MGSGLLRNRRAALELISIRTDSGQVTIAIFASLFLHLVLVWFLLHYVIAIVTPPRVFTVVFIRPATLDSPAKQPTGTRSGIPASMHFTAAGDTADLGMDLGPPAAGGGNGKGGLDAFDDAVKHRIEAVKTYPMGPPKMWMACVIEYQVTVNRGWTIAKVTRSIRVAIRLLRRLRAPRSRRPAPIPCRRILAARNTRCLAA